MMFSIYSITLSRILWRPFFCLSFMPEKNWQTQKEEKDDCSDNLENLFELLLNIDLKINPQNYSTQTI